MDSAIAPAGSVDNSSDNPHARDQKRLQQRARTKGGWNVALFINFVEMAERFAFYGLSGNLITYLTDHLHHPLATAAKNVNTWVGVSSIFPVLGALVADSYLGRFTTILIASVVYFIGMVLLALSVSVGVTGRQCSSQRYM
ncbi:unnamed protein product [Linum trigynum]|uniref:Uncharacterized protein n=1 Tax=Linum trigynum TaxID=586398 RepID=A0AAV2F8U8_9ROSI